MKVIGVIAFVLACNSSEKPKVPPMPDEIQTPVGPIKVIDQVPSDAEFMCSADYKTHPMTELHVIPMFNPSLGRYVGSYRCNADWKAAIAEVRARLHANLTEAEVAMFLQVFIERGVTKERLRTFVADKSLGDAADAALDALASGQIKLSP